MKMVTSGLARAEVTWAAPVSWNCIQYFAALVKENLSFFFKSFNDNEDWVRSQLAESNTGKSPITARPKNKAKANMKNYQCASLTQQ